MRISTSGIYGNDASATSSTSDVIFTFGPIYRFRHRAPPPRPIQRPSICPHKMLSLPCSASKVEVRSVYRRLAKIAHPDVAPPERREELSRWMVVLNRIYELLEAA